MRSLFCGKDWLLGTKDPGREGKQQQMAKKEGLNSWLQRVRITGEYSDLHVRLNGEEFHLHMLPLLNASSYFRNLPSSSEEGSKKISKEGYRIVTIPDLPGTAAPQL